jgi:hypothetical protein
LRKLHRPCFRSRFPFAKLMFALRNRLGTRVELLLTLGQPLPGRLPFGIQIGCLRGQLPFAAVQCALLRLQPVGQLGRVLAELLQ